MTCIGKRAPHWNYNTLLSTVPEQIEHQIPNTTKKTNKNMQFRKCKWLASQDPIDELIQRDLGIAIKQRVEPKRTVPNDVSFNQYFDGSNPSTQIKNNTKWQQKISRSQTQNCSRKTSPSPLSRMWNSAVPSCTSTLCWTGVHILVVLKPLPKKNQLTWKQPQLRTSVHQILWRNRSCIQSLEICLDFWI